MPLGEGQLAQMNPIAAVRLGLIHGLIGTL